jgi:hypothetical protein
MKKIMIAGDVHGMFSCFNLMIHKRSPSLVLQVGDFGYWPRQLSERFKPFDVPVFWCAGNHEYWPALTNIKGTDPVELWKNSFYCPSGTVIEKEGKRILFIGGAKSVDWKLRSLGKDVWPELECPDLDVASLPSEVDIIISHTMPLSITSQYLRSSFEVEKEKERRYGWDLSGDPMEKRLEEVLEKVSFEHWYAGHWHVSKTGVFHNGKKWTVLSTIEHRQGTVLI